MASTSKEEKPTPPLLPAVQPAPLSTAVQPAVQFAAVQQVNKLDIAQRHEQTLAIFACAAQGGVGARIVWRWYCIFFNTDQRAMYCVLYVFLFILYNTVFFIV